MIRTQEPRQIAEPYVVTEREFEKLPETNYRKVEVVDGVLRVSPDPTVAHQQALGCLLMALVQHCPPDLLCIIGTDVKLSEQEPLNVRIPDLLVIRKGAERMMPPSDVILAVEIISPSTRTQDRVHKAGEYAAAGIPSYWLVAPGKQVTLEAGRLGEDGRYHFSAPLAGRFHLDDPFPVDIDLDVLTR